MNGPVIPLDDLTPAESKAENRIRVAYGIAFGGAAGVAGANAVVCELRAARAEERAAVEARMRPVIDAFLDTIPPEHLDAYLAARRALAPTEPQ